MKQFYRQHKTVINTVCIILVTVLVVGIVGVMTNSFVKAQNSSFFGLRKANDNNLISYDDYKDLDGTKQADVKITVKSDGRIVLNGKASANTTIVIKTIAKTDKIVSGASRDGYTLSGIADGGISTALLVAKQGESILAMSAKYGAFIDGFSPDSDLVIGIHIAEGANLKDFVVTPVLVSGSTAESYYQ